MESHETLDGVQELKHTLKEILNVLKDIKGVFNNALSPREITTTVIGDDEFLKAIQVDVEVTKQLSNDSAETKPIKPTEKAKDNVEST